MRSVRYRLAHGFTLMEVLFSLGLLSIAGLAMAHAFTTQMSFNTRSERRSAAVMAAQQVLDRLRVQDPALMPTAGATTLHSVSVGGRAFEVEIRYCASMTYCTSPSVRTLNASVRFQGENVYSFETVYAQLQ